MKFFTRLRPIDMAERASHTVKWLSIAALAVFACLQWPVVAFIVFLVACFDAVSRSKRPGDTFGSARWATTHDLKNAGCLQPGGIRLGRMLSRTEFTLLDIISALFYPPWRTADALEILSSRSNRPPVPYVWIPDSGPPHLAVFAPPGAGKTTCFAVPNLLNDPASAIVLDAKGDLTRLTAAHREKNFGHKIVVIDPYGISVKPEHASQFNPLSLYRSNPLTIMDNTRRLANALVIRPKDEREPFFNSAAQVVIQTVLGFLLAEAKPEEATLNRLRDFLSNPKLMRELLEFLEKSDACDGILRRLAGNARWYQGQTEASVYAVANTHVEFLDSQMIFETLSRTSFAPQELIDGRMTIYLCLPVDRIHEMRGLQRIMLTSLINFIFQAGESLDRRIRFFLDEAVTLGEIDAVYNAMVYGRSFGMRLMFFYQSTSQVEQCFPESKAADFQASVASVFTGTNDYRTAKETSQWIGQTTVQSKSHQTNDNWGKSWNQSHHDHSEGGSSGGGTSTTYAEVGRALIQPEEVLQLPKSNAIALLPGTRPILVEKTPYYKASAQAPTDSSRMFRSLARSVITSLACCFVALSLRAGVIGPERAINEI
jgi:type IV secretion system protein VirD4